MSLPVIALTEADNLSYDFKGWHGVLIDADVPVGTFFLRCKLGSRAIVVTHPMTYEQIVAFDPDEYWKSGF